MIGHIILLVIITISIWFSVICLLNDYGCKQIEGHRPYWDRVAKRWGFELHAWQEEIDSAPCEVNFVLTYPSRGIKITRKGYAALRLLRRLRLSDIDEYELEMMNDTPFCKLP